jgi:hypothetical protein
MNTNPINNSNEQPKSPIDSVPKYDRFQTDGDGGEFDDFGTGLSEKRFCKGCHADVTGTMYCHCGDFALLKSETLSEDELNKLENGK